VPRGLVRTILATARGLDPKSPGRQGHQVLTKVVWLTARLDWVTKHSSKPHGFRQHLVGGSAGLDSQASRRKRGAYTICTGHFLWQMLLALSQQLSPLDLIFRFSILLPKFVCRLLESSKHINYLQFLLSEV